MYSQTSGLLESARKRRALRQEALASSLGVKQQTVSRWMKGESTPKAAILPALAAALDLSVHDIQAAIAADRRSKETTGADDDVPVRPLLPTLPLTSLPADRYEQFVADLFARLYPTADVSLIGGQGDDQRGFDVQARHPDGRQVFVQCKRETQFGPRKVAAAVAEAELVGDRHIIALARAATAAARFEVAKHDGWQLLDQIDLSRMIRSLPDESAHHLVRTYFPNHVEPFLGIAASSPWMTVDEYYRSTAYTVLDHHQDLVGRQGLVVEVRDWIIDTTAPEIAVVVGRGGLGKSKLLHDLAVSPDLNAEVRFLALGQTPSPTDFDLLPRDRQLVLVLDDAHNLDHVAAIAAQLRLHRPTAKLILASRPYGTAAIDAEIWQLGQAPSRMKHWTLTDLSDAEARELVAGLIGRSDRDPVTSQLAAISFDCPFIAVVGADLLSRGELSASAFASDATLRNEVVSRFGNQLAATGSSKDVAERRAVLNGLAAFQPVRLSDESFANAVTQLSRIDDWDEVSGRIRELEDLGLVLRRGDSVRVVPDMLGDVLLGEASYDDRSGAATSFIKRAHAAGAGMPFQHLLVNAARMDWQLRAGVATGGDLVGQLRATLQAELLRAEYDEQVALLKLLERIAYYQPAYALDMVRAVLDVDVETAEGPDNDRFRWRATRRDVINALSPVLRNVAYNLDRLPEALDILWSLAQEDDRATNQFPEHPLRILAELAEFRTGKPFEYLFAVIDRAKSWLAAGTTKISPFDVLEPVLAVEGSEQVSSGLSLTFYAFGLMPELVRDVRTRVIDLAVEQAKTAGAVGAVRGVKALEDAIRGPHGMFGRQPSADEVDAWAQEFVPTIEQLGEIGSDPARDPVVRIAVRRALAWHAEHGLGVTRQAAADALGRLHRDFVDDVALCVHDGWGVLGLRLRGDYQKAEQEHQAEFRRVAAALVDGRATSDVLDLLEERLGAERAALDGIESAGRFLWEVFAAEPGIALAVLDHVGTELYPVLTTFAAVAIAALAEQGYEAVIGQARRLYSSEVVLKRRVAHALSWNRGRRQQLLPGELELLKDMASDPDEIVRASTGRAVFMIGLFDKASAVELLSKIEFGSSGKVAAEAMTALIQQGPISWADTDEALENRILAQLAACDSIDKYEITSALSELSSEKPLEVVRMLMARIDRASQSEDREYRALPNHWDPPLQIVGSKELSQCLAAIRDWLGTGCSKPRSYRRSDDGASLYAHVAGSWTEQALSVLEVTNAATKDQLVAIAQILSQAPISVFLTQVELVTKILRCASSMANDDRERVFQILLPTNHEFVVSWSGDRPDTDVNERDQARRIASELPHGSIERRFFSQLGNALDARISFRMERPEPDFDGRDW
jgi:transcriptional regulator with XRE-family HTH domain